MSSADNTGEIAQVGEPLQQNLTVAQTHAEVLELTKRYIWQWLAVSLLNFVLHYMRLGVVMLYCLKTLGESNTSLVGGVVTLHYVALAVSNVAVSYMLDSHSFESMMFWRFGAVSVALIGEALAPSFAVFAVCYVLAALCFVIVQVLMFYSVRMLPKAHAASLNTVVLTVMFVGNGFGVVSGGLMAAFFGLRSVFVASAAFAVLCTVYMFTAIRNGEDEVIRRQTELKALYDEFPDAIALDERFPLPFVDGSEDVNSDQTVERKHSKLTSFLQFLCSMDGLPLVLILLSEAFRISAMSEFAVWWNVYCDDVWGISTKLSNTQSLVSLVFLCASVEVSKRVLPVFEWSNAKQLTFVLRWFPFLLLAVAIIYVFLAPFASFNAFWGILPVISTANGVLIPVTIARMAAESPPMFAGAVGSMHTMAVILSQGIQHSIIGALWNLNNSGSKHQHQWYFGWMAVLSLATIVVSVAYVFARRAVPNEVESESRSNEEPMAIASERATETERTVEVELTKVLLDSNSQLL